MADSTPQQTLASTPMEKDWGGLFTSSRHKPFPSIFPSHHTAVTCDVLYLGVLFGFIVLVLAFLSIFPTFIGLKEKMKVLSRVTCGLSIGVVIMACNFGQDWEVGALRTHTAYRAGSGQGIHADVGINLGLRSVNITLRAVEKPRGELAGEKINYNERFSWAWGQGNPGFGPYAGPIQRAFRAAQARGTPLPILWVAEYFTIDGEGVRFGRHYRHAGWYAHICVWTAFPLWILTLILFKMVVSLGAQTLTLTGTMLFSAALIWALYRNPIELQIPFDGGMLVTHFGIHWYLSLIVGAVCIVAGVTIFLLDYRYPGRLSVLFGNNPLNIVEQETGVEEDNTEAQTPGAKRMSLGLAGRRVVTTLRLRGSKASFKRVTHYPQGDWTSGQASQSSIDVLEADEEEQARGPGTKTRQQLSPPGQSLLSAPTTYKDGQVKLHLGTGDGTSTASPSGAYDNPAQERDDNDEEGNGVLLRDQSWI